MSEVVLEIGTEEIPALYIEDALKELERLVKVSLEEVRLPYKEIVTYGSPRRLALFIYGISDKQEDIFQKIKGPAYAMAYENDLKPKTPAIKFAESQGVRVEDLVVENTEKGKYIFAWKLERGKSSPELLAQIFSKVINDLSFPKSMRWEDKKCKFIRPIRWILALYNEEIIKFSIEGLTSGNETYGHRLLAPGKIEISLPQEYLAELKRKYVIVDQEIREKRIRKQIRQIIKEVKGREIINERQLKEVVYLVEYPTAILGTYHPDYLKLPVEVLTTVMEKHQKYFPVYKNKDTLLPLFIVISNSSKRYSSIIKKGNENVLKARLEDAKFFYQEDQKTSLEEKVAKLRKVVFRENWGSLEDKTRRLELLSSYLADALGEEQKVRDEVLRAAHLCKADLVTEMVKEFPELQGVMGREYALLSKEKKEVAEAIFEHYLPRFAEDLLPKTKSGMILGIADKVDNITGCFLMNLVPTGSQDPYGLRRQFRGMISIIFKNKLPLSLKEVFQKSLNGYKETVSGEFTEREEGEIIAQIFSFLKQRVKNIFLEEGIRYDIINAVLKVENNGDLVDIKNRIKAIEEFYNEPSFRKVINSSNRVSNLSKNSPEIDLKESLLKEKAEFNLYQQYNGIHPRIKKYVDQRKYKKVLKLLESLGEPIDEFFDQVLVMDKDPEIRNNRIALLKKIGALFNQVADLSEIVL